MNAKKNSIVEALKKHMGNVSAACDEIGISRRTFYTWKDEDAEFRDIVENMDEYLIDMAESSLFRLIDKGNVTAIIFYLKTKGKHRGYVEKQEVEHNVPASVPVVQWNFIDAKKKKDTK